LKRKREDEKTSEFKKASLLFSSLRKKLPRKAADDTIKVLQLFGNEIISAEETANLLEPLLRKEQGLMEKLREALGLPYIPPAPEWGKFIQAQGSYQRYPSGAMEGKCSGRGLLEDSVLNDKYFSMGRQEECSEPKFLYRRIRQEEELINIDDERHDWDLLDEQNSFAIRCLEDIQQNLNDVPQEELPAFTLTPEQAGGAVCLTAILRVYGDKGNAVLNELLNHPSSSLPFIKARLECVRVEYARQRREMNKSWRIASEKAFSAIMEHKIAIASEQLSGVLKATNLGKDIGVIAFPFSFQCARDCADVILANVRKCEPLLPSLAQAKLFQHKSAREQREAAIPPADKSALPSKPPLISMTKQIEGEEAERLSPLLEGVLLELCCLFSLPNESPDDYYHSIYCSKSLLLLIRCFAEFVGKVSLCEQLDSSSKHKRDRMATEAENAVNIPGRQR
jgi:hypothetical protein